MICVVVLEISEISTASESEIKQDVGSELLTKADFKSFTEEILGKFSDMYKTEKTAQAEIFKLYPRPVNI